MMKFRPQLKNILHKLCDWLVNVDNNAIIHTVKVIIKK